MTKKIAPYLPYVFTISAPVVTLGLKAFQADRFIQNKANDIEAKKRKRIKKDFKFFDEDTFNIEPNTKPLFDYVNRINSIQSNEFAICYHDGKMYIDKKYLETEVN